MALGQNIPLFFRFYHKLKHAIIQGELEKGSKINTIEELAQMHGISQISVRKGLDLLEREGFLNKIQGWGTIVPDNVDLRLYDLGTIITLKNVTPEMEQADIEALSAEWINLTPRLKKLFCLKKTASQKLIYKLYARVHFKWKLTFRALITYYFSENWMREYSLDESTSPREIILNIAKWMESTPLKIRESLLPFLCTDQHAELLGLTDGTPIFFETMVLKERGCDEASFCLDMISTANTFIRELDIN
jgi:DNA-binding GntR family transcriptional regulator